MTPLDVIRRLGQRLAYRELPWLRAVDEHERAGIDPWDLQRARAELGEPAAAATYEAARAERTTPQEIAVDDLTEIDRPGEGWTVDQLIVELTRRRTADPDVGKMRVLVGSGVSEVHRVEVSTVREPAIDEDDYVVVLR